MKMKILPKKLNLAARMMILTLGSILIINALILLLIANSSAKREQEIGIELAVSKSIELAHDAQIYFSKASETLNSLSTTITTINYGNNISRETLKNLFYESLNQDKTYLAGWQTWEPNAFDGKDAAYMSDPIFKASNGAINFSYFLSGKDYVIKKGLAEKYTQNCYLIPKNDSTLTILEPYKSSYSGKTSDSVDVISIIKPIIKGDRFLGNIGFDFSLETLSNIIKLDTLKSKGYSSLITNNLTIASHPDDNIRGQKLSVLIDENLEEIKDSIQKGKMIHYIDVSNITGKKVLRCFAPINIGNSQKPWAVMFEIPMKEISTGFFKTMIKMASIGLLGILLLSIIIYLISQKIVKQIKKSADFAKEVAKGNLNVKYDLDDRDDEIGDMTKAQKNMVNKLVEIVENVSINASNIFSASQQLNSTATDLSQGANEQAASTEEVSASMEEMAANIDQNSVNASQTEQIAVRAASEIEEVSTAVLVTVDAMKQIAEKISIIGVIAEKTDLLAINAAIEAARAGEHGLGFTVVASEIRKLAERSQDAAKQINELTKSSVQIADKSSAELMGIIPDIKKTAELVQEIYAASLEQKAGADQINNAIMQLNAVTQRNAAASEEMSASSEELYAQAEQLKDVIDFYKFNEKEKGTKKENYKKLKSNEKDIKQANDGQNESLYLDERESENNFEKF
jgi:methyl-accepting chemotaxis protein